MGEIVEAQRLGYVVDLGDRSSLEIALADAARRRDEWRNPARTAPGIREEHVFDHYVPRLLEVYRSAFHRRHGRAAHV
ncbi:hypothetical protein D3C83_197760 [compost metagenome]